MALTWSPVTRLEEFFNFHYNLVEPRHIWGSVVDGKLLRGIRMHNIESLLVRKIPCKAIFKPSFPFNEFGRQFIYSPLPGGAPS